MESRVNLKHKECVVYFIFTDGSMVRSVCTASKDIVQSHNIFYRGDGLYDLETGKKIPMRYLELDTRIYSIEDDVDQRGELDLFMNNFIKNLW